MGNFSFIVRVSIDFVSVSVRQSFFSFFLIVSLSLSDSPLRSQSQLPLLPTNILIWPPRPTGVTPLLLLCSARFLWSVIPITAQPLHRSAFMTHRIFLFLLSPGDSTYRALALHFPLVNMQLHLIINIYLLFRSFNTYNSFSSLWLKSGLTLSFLSISVKLTHKLTFLLFHFHFNFIASTSVMYIISEGQGIWPLTLEYSKTVNNV